MGINLVISSLVLVIKYDLYMFLMGVRVHFYACTSMSIDMEGNELMQSVFRTGQSDSHVLIGIYKSKVAFIVNMNPCPLIFINHGVVYVVVAVVAHTTVMRRPGPADLMSLILC